ncbi:hypothetical protein ES703_37228 [subsurface metagenome]
MQDISFIERIEFLKVILDSAQPCSLSDPIMLLLVSVNRDREEPHGFHKLWISRHGFDKKFSAGVHHEPETAGLIRFFQKPPGAFHLLKSQKRFSSIETHGDGLFRMPSGQLFDDERIPFRFCILRCDDHVPGIIASHSDSAVHTPFALRITAPCDGQMDHDAFICFKNFSGQRALALNFDSIKP